MPRRVLVSSLPALVVVALVLAASVVPARADCAENREQEGGTYGYLSLSPGSGPYICPETGEWRPVVTPMPFRCSDGTQWVCYPSNAELQEAFPGWQDQCDGALTFNFCDQCDSPGCKTGGEGQERHPTRDSAKEAGDPVDLTTGALKLTVTDLDLGGGLRFTRHYSSAFDVQNLALETSMGAKWRHSLQWAVSREVGQNGEHVVRVHRPLEFPEIFVSHDPELGSPWMGSQRNLGTLEGSFTGELTYTSANGTQVVFGTDDRVGSIAIPGERAITVSYAGDTTTFSNGNASLAVTHWPSGTFKAGKVQQVSGGGHTVAYDYVLRDYTQYDVVLLSTITAPDFSRDPGSDTVLLTYGYTAASTAQVASVDRTDAAGTKRLGTWTYVGNVQVRTADEAGLDQPLKLWYDQDGTVEVTKVCEGSATCDANSGALATVRSDGGVVKQITGLGGPGYQPRFKSGTTQGGRWRTRRDQNDNRTLYEAYDEKGRPGRTVEGWLDNDASGSFTAGDGYARVTEYTWHARVEEPYTITRESNISGQPAAITTFDYDDDNGAGTPNQDPTDLVHARIQRGVTLDETGAAQPVEAITRFTYDADGRVLTVAGPRTANFTQHVYDPVTGYRTATRRYVNGPSSSYLETLFSDFDARGNPETVTDPNGRVTEFTYLSGGTRGRDYNHLQTLRQCQAALADAIRRVKLHCVPPPPELPFWEAVRDMQFPEP